MCASLAFVATFDQRLRALGEAISTADREAFVAAAERATADGVIPAYRRIRDFLVNLSSGSRAGYRTETRTVWGSRR
jgi:hypothetical protein